MRSSCPVGDVDVTGRTHRDAIRKIEGLAGCATSGSATATDTGQLAQIVASGVELVNDTVADVGDIEIAVGGIDCDTISGTCVITGHGDGTKEKSPRQR